MKDFVYIKDNFLTDDECDQIISTYKPKVDGYVDYTGYNSFFITENIPHIDKIISITGEYVKKFPEIQQTPNQWRMGDLRFQWWEPGKSFSNFHCEHTLDNARRVAGFQVYLSSHNCGTEFYTGEVIKSVKGRAVIFPAFWTHLHRGQVCPDNLDRYMIIGYYFYHSDKDQLT